VLVLKPATKCIASPRTWTTRVGDPSIPDGDPIVTGFAPVIHLIIIVIPILADGSVTITGNNVESTVSNLFSDARVLLVEVNSIGTV
jgi:hypothetical protein